MHFVKQNLQFHCWYKNGKKEKIPSQETTKNDPWSPFSTGQRNVKTGIID